MSIEAKLKNMPEMETDRLLLRKITLDDVDDLFEFSSDPDVSRYMRWETNEAKEETMAFVRAVIQGYGNGTSGDWAIVHKKHKKVIGTCAFVSWSNEHQKAEIGFILHQGYWGQGFALEAVTTFITYGSEVLKLNRIEGHCDPENIGSEKVMRKAGMTFEGVLRKNERIKGEFSDTKIFSILKEEYRGNYSS